MAQLCEEFHEWVEEEIEKPIEEWREERVRKCKRRKCKKWCLCCNKWFCWIETIVVRVVTWVVVTVGKWVVRVVCEVVNVALDAIGAIAGLIFAIPIIGRLIRQIWDFFVELVWQVTGVLGVLADILGIDIRKKLRICIIILRDEKGSALTTEAALASTIQDTKTIWKDAANVDVIVQDVHTILEGDLRESLLDVNCDFGAWTDDLLAPGANFELMANIYCFDGAGRKLIGWGAPITVFCVRSIKNKRGCSLGVFSDYVTIEARRPGCLAHELGHACYLYWEQHHSDPVNLMHSSCNGTELEKWQKVLMRNSRHVTYI